MRPLRLRRSAVEGAAALACGIGLFELVAAVERAGAGGTLAAAAVEECGKTAVLIFAGLLGRSAAARARSSGGTAARRRRELLLGGARGLSLGLVSIAVFVATENLAYFAAFPVASTLSRLAWALPVHLVAALVEAVGVFLFLQVLAGRDEEAPRGASPVPWAAGAVLLLAMGAGTAWHTAANLVVIRGLDTTSLVAGSLAGSVLAALIFALFLRRAYIGGFLHGSD